MRIGFNTLSENPKFPSGSLDFFVQLTRELVRCDQENQYFILASKTNQHLFAHLRDKARVVVAGVSNENPLQRILSEQTTVPYHIKKLDLDVFFSSGGGGVAPLVLPRKTKLVLGAYSTHHLHGHVPLALSRRVFRRAMTIPAFRKAALVVANSQICKEDIIRGYGVAEKKVRLIYHGLNLSRFHDGPLTPEDLDYLAKFRVKTPYLLFVSVIWFYKNVHTLVEAFGRAVHRHRLPHNLVLVGAFDKKSGITDQYRYQLMAIAEKYGVQDRLNFVGFVAENLRPFYQGADIYIQPSFYETFGKTVVEAFACGCPVIASNAWATPEIVGDAGILFNPASAEELSEAIHRVLGDPSLREAMRARGKERAALFSMESETREFIKVFNELNHR